MRPQSGRIIAQIAEFVMEWNKIPAANNAGFFPQNTRRIVDEGRRRARGRVQTSEFGLIK